MELATDRMTLAEEEESEDLYLISAVYSYTSFTTAARFAYLAAI